MSILDRLIRRSESNLTAEDEVLGRVRGLGRHALLEIGQLLLRPIDEFDIAAYGNGSMRNLVDACRQYMTRELTAVQTDEYLLPDVYQCLVNLFRSEYAAGQILNKLIEYGMAEINDRAHIVLRVKNCAQSQKTRPEIDTTVL